MARKPKRLAGVPKQATRARIAKLLAEKSKAIDLKLMLEITQKQWGVGSVRRADRAMADRPRIPTNIFSMDYALGGGVPVYGTLTIYGGFSSGKTSACLQALKSLSNFCFKCYRPTLLCQCEKPMHKFGYWVDAEGDLDIDWAQSLGANPKRFMVASPEYGEQGFHMAELGLKVGQVGLVVIDSIAALRPIAEMEMALEDQDIGTMAKLVGKACSKFINVLQARKKQRNPVALIMTNQLRIKIGQLFGDPEYMIGGEQLKHISTFILKTKRRAHEQANKEKYIDKKEDIELATRHSFQILKHRILRIRGSGDYIRAIDTIKKVGLEKGQIDDCALVWSLAKRHGLIKKKGGQFIYNDRSTAKKTILGRWKEDINEYDKVKWLTIEAAKEKLRRGE